MKNIVIIKLFKPEYESADFHDLYLEGHLGRSANADIAKLKEFGKKIDKTILFAACNMIDVANFEAFAEISYSGTLSEEEKKTYTEIIKRFSRDAVITRRGELEIYPVHTLICFHKIEPTEIIET